MKPLKPLRPQPPQAAREDVIVFAVGGYKLAIAAGVVKEIRGMEDLHAFTLGGISSQIAKLKYTLERNGTTYFVVDAAQHFQLPESHGSRVMVLRNVPTGVLVDSTDRILEISSLHALPRAFTHEERGWYRGLAVVNGSVVPVVNHNAFLNRAELEVLRAGLERVRGVVTV
ncbi:MAG TPA: chemotaxis protein CheW [Candidatus Angelobacter sp.]|nr:chemotaxis protein CheW [Candidatus Angelobacter sp.]